MPLVRQGQEDGQSPWRGRGPPHSLLPFLWSVPDPLTWFVESEQGVKNH